MEVEHISELSKYKEKIIDPVSSTFCAAKWYNATIWLGHGQTTSCHQPPGHWIPLEELKDNHTAIHNTKHKKLMRKYMLAGKRPAECFQCWQIEDSGKNRISERVLKTSRFTDEDVLDLPNLPWDANIRLRTIEISFDRACNFACSYCNPAFSSTWVKDIKQNGPYQNIQSDARGHFVDAADWAEKATPKDEDNPYIQAFWKWWEEELADCLEEVRVTGGEPILHPSVWKLFNWFKDNPKRGRNMIFSINTNLVPEKEKTFDKLLQISQYLPNFQVFTSCESVGKQAEYIRDGLRYDVWLSNIRKLLDQPGVKQLWIMSTINSLCLGRITEFLDDMLELKKVYGEKGPMISLNLLLFPVFQSIAILPEYIQSHYNKKLKAWYTDDKKELLKNIEIVHVERLIHHIDYVKKQPRDAHHIKKTHNDFKTFYTQYDKRRNKNFYTTFDPIMVEWFDSLTVEESTSITGVGDPASTEIY